MRVRERDAAKAGLALALLLVQASTFVAVSRAAQDFSRGGDPRAANETVLDNRINLECEPENGFPNSVSCAGSEWFVKGYSNFREDLADSGLMPYGQVHCCTPDRVRSNVDSIHVKCSARRGVNNCAFLRHKPENLSSFLTGFSGSLRIDTDFAPQGDAICCDAIALLADGTRRYISPCDCVATKEVMCPSPGRVMTGFLVTTNIGVPLTPSSCCSMCLGELVPPDSDCKRYDRCHGHGVCHGGFCECLDGFGGMDCSLRQVLSIRALFRDYSWDVLVCSLSGALVFLWVFLFVRRASDGEGAGGRDADGRRGTFGSLGSGDGGAYAERLALLDTDEETSSEEDVDESAATEDCAEKGELKNVAAEGAVERRLRGAGEDACSICMSSEKLVVLVPCGHTNICKRCARRVDSCPFCREPIARRQKIYFAGN